SGSPATPETVRLEIASAAIRTRSSLRYGTLRGRAKHHDHAQVRVRSTAALTASAYATAAPKRRPIANTPTKSTRVSVTANSTAPMASAPSDTRRRQRFAEDMTVQPVRRSCGPHWLPAARRRAGGPPPPAPAPPPPHWPKTAGPPGGGSRGQGGWGRGPQGPVVQNPPWPPRPRRAAAERT